jgi:lipopolysaccharide/colanic/teichoic acid biosynthesis glycosyltransferase
MATDRERGLSPLQAVVKRAIDLVGALVGLALTWWVIVIAYVVATIDTRANGFFVQPRVGRHGRMFKVIKIRTMRAGTEVSTTVTTDRDPRITRVGRILRKAKIDELPQLLNVLLGQMSFVGPRPDVPGFADRLQGEDRLILSVRPGITGPATLAYRDEETLLAAQGDPEAFNLDVVYPDKVRINLDYIRNYSVWTDLSCMVQSVSSIWRRPE